MAKTLELKFDLANGKTMSLSIQDPKDNLTPSEVTQAMQTIINQNIFHQNSYGLVGINQARIVERNVTDIQLV